MAAIFVETAAIRTSDYGNDDDDDDDDEQL